MTVRRAIVSFVLSLLAVVVVVGVVGVYLLHRSATNEALDDARSQTQAVGRSTVVPLLTSQLFAGEASARAPLDAVLARNGFGSQVEHVKLWDADGRVLYASEPGLIGQRFELGGEEREALEELGSAAEVSDLTEPENEFERGEGSLVEVYAGLEAPGGRRVLFETYRPSSQITANEGRLRGAFAPALVVAVLLLVLLLLPLVLGLARSLERGRAEREALLRRALEASDRERTRVARELHDGPVQRLSGVAFALAGAERLPEGSDLRATLHDGAAQVRETVRELRGTLTELVPPNLHRQGLRVALSDLLAPLRAAGLETTLHVDDDLALSDDVTEALYRAAAEGSRNVLDHARASTVEVTLRVADRRAVLTVLDDGRGVPDEIAAPEGHFGLRLLEELARERDGSFSIGRRDGAGTQLRFEVPA